MKKKRPRGAPNGSANAAKPKEEHRVPLQVRIAPDASRLLEKNEGKFKNRGHAVDAAIRKAWERQV
jgi:hypothetical protein